MSDLIDRLDNNQELLDHIVDSFQLRIFWKDKDSRFIA